MSIRSRWRRWLLFGLAGLALLVVAAWAAASHEAWNNAFGGVCRGLNANGVRLVDELPLRYPNGQADQSRACLAYLPDDVYGVVLTSVNSLDEFRAAKATAADRLRAKGFDPCLVVWWTTSVSWLPSSWDEQMTNTGECAPNVIAADDGAAGWVPDVHDAVAQVMETTAEQVGWHLNRPLGIVVVTDPEVAVQASKRYLAADPNAPLDEYTEQTTRAGRSSTFWLTRAGSIILVNLVGVLSRQQPREAVRASIRRIIAHEYTHAAQRAILGDGNIPRWFEEGQAVYQEYRAFGHGYVDVRYAAEWQHEGKSLHLADLSRGDGWLDHEQSLGSRPIYNRSYAVVAFLAERYGFPATVQLLRGSRDRGVERFDDLLAELTGMNPDELDAAVDEWLLEPGRVLLSDDFTSPSSPWMAWSGLPSQELDYYRHEYAIHKPEGKIEEGNAQPVWLRDFHAEIDGRLEEPTSDAGLWLTLCSPPDGGCYIFGVEPDTERFSVHHGLYEGGFETLIDWTYNPAIRPGTSINQLGLQVKGAALVPQVNGEDVARLEDEYLRGGVLWFGVLHRGGGPAAARFSRLLVTNAD